MYHSWLLSTEDASLKNERTSICFKLVITPEPIQFLNADCSSFHTIIGLWSDELPLCGTPLWILCWILKSQLRKAWNVLLFAAASLTSFFSFVKSSICSWRISSYLNTTLWSISLTWGIHDEKNLIESSKKEDSILRKRKREKEE